GEATHYIVLCYTLKVLKSELNLPDDQHREYLWLTKHQINAKQDVHNYSKNYFL
ncbi:GDP-sugar hydrolase WbdI, partial [Escherichia coli]|nr:GDP-sugar hydrolase WbdI [Escherichia coli]